MPEAYTSSSSTLASTAEKMRSTTTSPGLGTSRTASSTTITAADIGRMAWVKSHPTAKPSAEQYGRIEDFKPLRAVMESNSVNSSDDWNDDRGDDDDMVLISYNTTGRRPEQSWVPKSLVRLDNDSSKRKRIPRQIFIVAPTTPSKKRYRRSVTPSPQKKNQKKSVVVLKGEAPEEIYYQVDKLIGLKFVMKRSAPKTAAGCENFQKPQSKSKKALLFHVKWKGSGETSWEPASCFDHLTFQDAERLTMKEFDRQCKGTSRHWRHRGVDPSLFRILREDFGMDWQDIYFALEHMHRPRLWFGSALEKMRSANAG